MEKVRQLLEKNLNENTLRAVVSNRRSKQVSQKLVFRPFIEKNRLMFQREEYANNQVFHENMDKETTVEQICTFLEKDYKQLDLLCEQSSFSALVSKKGKSTIKENKNQIAKKIDLSHNRKKRYILDTDEVIPFLVDLGVQTKEGKIVDKKYKKYKQINRFLEFVKDVLPELPKDRPVKIIDFGCGKSYLTFAVYYYLHIMNGRDVEMIGLDLKKDVIEFCNKTAQELGYGDLTFLTGDIADYKSTGADMVVTLHACDTATDYALINAVKWHSRVILSVPCCQHELFSQIKEPVNDSYLKYGILKDKFTEILTDGLRGLKLESAGYQVNMIEFTSLEHTARNVMIKAVLPDPAALTEKQRQKQEAAKEKASQEYEALKNMYHVHPTIDQL